MMSLFSTATNDKALYYLGMIFGNMGDVLSGTGPEILSLMFKTFNVACLSLGAGMVIYTTVMGTLSTAHEGRFMGQKMDSIWVPLRTVGGIVALVPFKGSGYSTLQVLLMWIVIQGIGAADAAWSTAVDYLAKGGVLATPKATYIPGLTGGIKQIFSDLSCSAAYDATPFISGEFTSSKRDAVAFVYNFPSQSSGLSGTVFPTGCGALKWTESLDSLTGQMQGAAYRQIIPTLLPLAQDVVKVTNQYCTCAVAYQKARSDNPDDIAAGTAAITANACKPPADYCKTPSTDNTPPSINRFLEFGLIAPLPPVDAAIYSCAQYNVCSQLSGENKKDFSDRKDKIATQLLMDEIYPSAGSNFLVAAENLYAGYLFKAIGQSRMRTAPVSGFTNAAKLVSGSIGAVGSLVGIGGASREVSQKVLDLGFSALELPGGAVDKLMQRSETDADEVWGPAKVNGWIMAGAYYYTIATSGNNFPASKNIKKIDISANAPTGARKMPAAQAYDFSGRMLDYLDDQRSLGESKLKFGKQRSRGLLKPIYDMEYDIFNAFISLIGGDDSNSKGAPPNPIIGVQSTGNMILDIVMATWLIMMALIAAIMGVTAIGSCVNSAGYVTNAMLQWILPGVTAIMAAFFVIGGIMAVYVPMIPYMYFTFASIGWLLGAIEAIVAAPPVALGLLHPSNLSKPALLLSVAIFFRPLLMVFGMVTGMLLSFVVILLINATFKGVMLQVTGGSPGPLELLFFLGTYAGFVIESMTRCFEAIYALPDKALRWIGHQDHSAQETGHMAQAAKGYTEGAGKGAQGIYAGQSGAMARRMAEQGKSTGKVQAQGGGAGGGGAAGGGAGAAGGGAGAGGGGGGGAGGGGDGDEAEGGEVADDDNEVEDGGGEQLAEVKPPD